MSLSSARASPQDVGVRVAGHPFVPVRKEEREAVELCSGERSFDRPAAERGPERPRLAIPQDDRPVVNAGDLHGKDTPVLRPSEGGAARALLAEGDGHRDVADGVVDHVVVLQDPPRVGPGVPGHDDSPHQIIVTHVGGRRGGPVFGVVEGRQLACDLPSSDAVGHWRAVPLQRLGTVGRGLVAATGGAQGDEEHEPSRPDPRDTHWRSLGHPTRTRSSGGAR